MCPACKAASDCTGPFYRMDRGARLAIGYILSCPLKKLLSFKLGDKSLLELEQISKQAILFTFDTYFDSLRFYEDRQNEQSPALHRKQT